LIPLPSLRFKEYYWVLVNWKAVKFPGFSASNSGFEVFEARGQIEEKNLHDHESGLRRSKIKKYFQCNSILEH
jgi:hypothetical protein